MAKAYLKINVATGQERSVKGEILKIQGVKAADLTAGEQDIMCIIEAASYEQLLQLIVNKIRSVKGVASTITNLVLD